MAKLQQISGEGTDVADEGLAPDQLPNDLSRPHWQPEQVTRSAGTVELGSNARVYVEHREVPGLVFRVDVSANGNVVGLGAQPLRFRIVEERIGGGMMFRYVEVDDGLTSGQADTLTAGRFKALPWGDVLAAGKQVARRATRALLGGTVPESRWPALLADRRPGPKAKDPLFWAGVALDYVRVVVLGGGRVKDLAARRGTKPQTMAVQIMNARNKGMLTETGERRSGGDLTPEALELLRDAGYLSADEDGTEVEP